MKLETDRTKRQTRVAHRERMKRLDKAQKRADAKYEKNLDVDEETAKAIKAHRKRMKRLDRADGIKSGKWWLSVIGIIAFVLTVLYYAMIVMSWYEAPLFMFLGWSLKKLKSKKPIIITAIITVVIMVLYYAMFIHSWYIAPLYMAFGWCVEKLIGDT